MEKGLFFVKKLRLGGFYKLCKMHFMILFTDNENVPTLGCAFTVSLLPYRHRLQWFH